MTGEHVLVHDSGLAAVVSAAGSAGLQTRAAGAAAAVGTTALAAAFGLVGAEFAVAFEAAQVRYAAAIGELAAVHDSIAAATAASGASYEFGDSAAASRIGGRA